MTFLAIFDPENENIERNFFFYNTLAGRHQL